MKRRILSWMLLAVLGLGTAYYLLLWPSGQGSPVFSPVRCAERTLVIDAGHGGEDGGAVSLSGVPESGINLAIALKLDQMLGLYGVAPLLLRMSDVSLHDEGAATMRERKVSDIHNRAAAVEAVENAVLISIHQNTYPESQYHGAQVFYAGTGLSQEFAQLTQQVLLAVDPDNTRKPAKIPDTVYLMNHISCPAILVECGFLSNPEEDRLLQTDAYQSQLAAALAASWLQYSQTL